MLLTESRYSTPEADCPSEESVIRLALEGKPGIRKVTVDLEKGEVSVVHSEEAGSPQTIAARIPFKAIHLSSRSVMSEAADIAPGAAVEGERRVLFWLLGLNLSMFVVELVVGTLAESSGLIADGLDMLADSLVYGLSLASIKLGSAGRLRATRLSAALQGMLGVLALAQGGWRFAYGSEPEAAWMMGISLLALAVNVACLALISRFRKGRMHMQASWIFSSNDVIANLAVIAAGALVAWTGSRYPDLIAGAGICVLVLRGSFQIGRLASEPEV